MKTLIPFIALFLVGCSTADMKNSSDTIKIHIQPIADFQTPSEFEFLTVTLDQKKIVQIGESIHMTNEQPLARVGLIRFLKEKKNFDILTFEGSTLDFWIAMDTFLQSKKKEKDITSFRKMAFFGLWQTKEMEQVLKSALLTSAPEKPLYIASFDIQPGIGFGFRKRNPFLEFGKILKSYNSDIANKDLQPVVSSLTSLQGCAQNGFPKNVGEKDLASKSISTLENWIVKTEPKIKKKYPNIPHAEALSLVPFSLRQTVELCDAHQKNTDTQNKWSDYQSKRDELSAEVAVQILKKGSRNNRMITWAHHSHVNYNTLSKVRVTLGQALKNQFGNDVFTIGVFAREGSALVGQEEPTLKKLRPVQDAEIDIYLSALSNQSFFLDLSGTAAKDVGLFHRPATIRIEGIGIWKAQLAKDYEAIIYLDTVSPPQADFSPM